MIQDKNKRKDRLRPRRNLQLFWLACEFFFQLANLPLAGANNQGTLRTAAPTSSVIRRQRGRLVTFQAFAAQSQIITAIQAQKGDLRFIKNHTALFHRYCVFFYFVPSPLMLSFAQVPACIPVCSTCQKWDESLALFPSPRSQIPSRLAV